MEGAKNLSVGVDAILANHTAPVNKTKVRSSPLHFAILPYLAPACSLRCLGEADRADTDLCKLAVRCMSPELPLAPGAHAARRWCAPWAQPPASEPCRTPPPPPHCTLCIEALPLLPLDALPCRLQQQQRQQQPHRQGPPPLVTLRPPLALQCTDPVRDAALGHERGPLQLLPRLPRVPPGDAEQPAPGDAGDGHHGRRDARHQGPLLLVRVMLAWWWA